MAPRTFTRRSFVLTILLVLVVTAALPQMAQAAPRLADSAVPDRATFIASVADGNRKVLRGVYVEGVLALPVLQQSYRMQVLEVPGSVTQFGMAAQYGVTGLLAHNWLSGQDFFQLQVGQQVDLVYGDGRVDSFMITEIQRYQVTMPGTSYEGYVSLETGKGTDTEGMFRRVYTGSRHVTFQTCIEQGGDPSWGRLFVIAEPMSVLANTGKAQQIQ